MYAANQARDHDQMVEIMKGCHQYMVNNIWTPVWIIENWPCYNQVA